MSDPGTAGRLAQALGDVQTAQMHESAIAWLDVWVATKKRHAAEDLGERQANHKTEGRE